VKNAGFHYHQVYLFILEHRCLLTLEFHRLKLQNSLFGDYYAIEYRRE